MLFSIESIAQVNQWRDIYEAKKKDTVFGIARKYGISVPDLMDANPEMKKEGYELKKGDTVFIPFVKKQTAATIGSVKTQTPVTKESAKPKSASNMDITKRAIRIGVMLPLHDVDGDGRRMVEYYRGMLLACDDLKAKGISTDIHAWNVPIDVDIRQTL
ncbi:MAG: LysM peptidoglycan-binding domain-containing protein, partial [Hoylesella buccalis]